LLRSPMSKSRTSLNAYGKMEVIAIGSLTRIRAKQTVSKWMSFIPGVLDVSPSRNSWVTGNLSGSGRVLSLVNRMICRLLGFSMVCLIDGISEWKQWDVVNQELTKSLQRRPLGTANVWGKMVAEPGPTTTVFHRTSGCIRSAVLTIYGSAAGNVEAWSF